MQEGLDARELKPGWIRGRVNIKAHEQQVEAQEGGACLSI